ncbi:hypothetical protein ACJ73_07638 [Blastomyces percursus]|uniref:Dipeptidyl-peptidase V n=1 Tax=Blastomyces percursus TaxID=1658174 RepID=A0A1J9PXF9_9EURO|nr:hypothetical protein ACJ73_07638 [Blastomyces percursus]
MAWECLRSEKSSETTHLKASLQQLQVQRQLQTILILSNWSGSAAVLYDHGYSRTEVDARVIIAPKSIVRAVVYERNNDILSILKLTWGLLRVMLSAPRRSAAIPNASGTLLAYTQTTYSFETHATTSELRVLDVASGSSVLLTNSYHGSPQWLGDGDKLVWLQDGEKGSTNFIVGCGQRKEDPYVAGTVSAPVSNLKLTTLSPGLVGLAVSGKANPDGSIYNPSTAKKPLSSGKLYTSLFVRHWDEYITPQKNAIWLGTLQKASSSAEDKRSRYKLSELKNLFNFIGWPEIESPIPPFGGTDHFDICPHGIVFVAKDPNLNQALHTRCVVFICNMDAGSWTQAVPISAKSLSLNRLKGAITSPVISPKSNTLAILAMREDGYESDKNRIIIVPGVFDWRAEQPQPVEIFANTDGSGSWNLSPSSLTWGENDSDIFVRVEDTGCGTVFRLPLTDYTKASTNHMSKLTHSGYVTSVAPASSKLFITSTSFVENSAFSVFDLTKPSQQPKLICSGSRHGAALGLFPEQVSDVWWRGAEDHPIHAWVIKPSNFDPKKKYPLCYLIHGGPQGAWNDQWNTRWNPAVFAEQGYVVITPNPTGSTGYGQAFTDAIQNEWGGKPYEDIALGFEYIEKELEYVDTTRAVALGASYGGFMVNWIQGHELGRRFKALVTHDGIFSTKFSLAAEELYFPIRDLKGIYWQVPENWDRWDPSLHLDKWETPHLIIHNELDYRLTIAEGLAAFNVLQMRGVPSAFLMFPDENHWVLKPENSLVWYRTVLNWINKHVGLPLLFDKDGSDGFPVRNEDAIVRDLATLTVTG